MNSRQCLERRPTQRQRVINYIRERGSLTRREAAYELGIFELAARISELEAEGYTFDKSGVQKFTTRDGVKSWCVVYKLVDEPCRS